MSKWSRLWAVKGIHFAPDVNSLLVTWHSGSSDTESCPIESCLKDSHPWTVVLLFSKCVCLCLQPSWYVQSLLFHLCLEVNKVGGHAVPRITLTELLRACLDQVLTEYEKLTEPTQNKVCLFLHLSLIMSVPQLIFSLIFDLLFFSVCGVGCRASHHSKSRLAAPVWRALPQCCSDSSARGQQELALACAA